MSLTFASQTFSAEGEYEQVVAQFDRWMKELKQAAPPVPAMPPAENQQPPLRMRVLLEAGAEKLFKENGEAIQLMSSPDGDDGTLNGILAILLGFKELKNNDKVTGGRIKQSLEISGIPIDRVDRIVDEHRDLIQANGVRRGKKYSLTTKGLDAAKRIAHDLLEKIPD